MSNRFVKKWTRVYWQGTDISGWTRSWGEAGAQYQEVGESEPMLTEDVKGVLIGKAEIMAGPISSIMNNVTDGMHERFNSQSNGVLSIALGFDGAPAAGDPCFSAEFEQMQYKGEVGDDVPITLNLATTAQAAGLSYDRPWGRLLHPLGAETGVNSSTSDYDHGSQTTFGGYMAYHLSSSNGTVTLKVQDAATDLDGSFGDLLSSGSLDASTDPASGVVALATTATVERYVRWQLTFGTATTATFLISFHRAIRV